MMQPFCIGCASSSADFSHSSLNAPVCRMVLPLVPWGYHRAAAGKCQAMLYLHCGWQKSIVYHKVHEKTALQYRKAVFFVIVSYFSTKDLQSVHWLSVGFPS